VAAVLEQADDTIIAQSVPGTITLPAPPTPGNVLVLAMWSRNGLGDLPTGFDAIAATGDNPYLRLAEKVADGSEDSIAVVAQAGIHRRFYLMEWSGVELSDASNAGTYGNIEPPAVGAGYSGHVIALYGYGSDTEADGITAISPSTDVYNDDVDDAGNGPQAVVIEVSPGPAEADATSSVVSFAAQGFAVANFPIVGAEAPEPPPPYVDPEPGQAIIEIYVDDPDGYRWDVAEWDEATWAEAAWVSITEWCIFADVTWGADRPDAGILADQVAGNWVIETHDPDRVLDPANDESPFYPHLVPELPIRVNHNSRTVRTGQVSIITYSHEREGGRISASDAVSRTSRADVPPGTALGDTFFERTTDAINGAGIDLWVSFPSGELMDRPLASADVDARRSVWQRISEAARELLAVPWVDRDGHIRVTEWDEDTDRGLVIGSDQMVDLTPWVSHDGLYSVVRALDSDEVTIAEAVAAPLPAYGERVYERTEPTIDAASWVTRVLADRQGAVLRYRPGTIRAWTAAQNDALVDMELMDIITLSYPETDPPIEVRARVLGARVRVTDRTKRYPGNVLTRWEWTLLTTLVPSVPLIADDEADLTYLVSDEDGTSYLYPG
jgi:hypothetical protein